MKLSDMLIGCLVMFAVTYATKAVTLLFFRKDIKNKYVRSFLYYLPYSVLAYFRKGLLPVSLASIGTVFLVEWILWLV